MGNHARSRVRLSACPMHVLCVCVCALDAFILCSAIFIVQLCVCPCVRVCVCANERKAADVRGIVWLDADDDAGDDQVGLGASSVLLAEAGK